MPKSAIPNFIISISKILFNKQKNIFQYIFESLIPIKFHFVTNIQICMSIYNSIPFPETKIIEGNLEVKLPTIWTVEKQR